LEETRSAYRILAGKSSENVQLGRPEEDVIEVHLYELG
jgi:hypothetical protein